MTMPYPESRSTPTARMSSAVCIMAFRIWALVYPGLTDLTSAATAAAWGAAADVPKNGRKPGVLDDAPRPIRAEDFRRIRGAAHERLRACLRAVPVRGRGADGVEAGVVAEGGS